MNNINKFIAKNPKFALWGSIIGTVVVVFAGIIVYQQMQKKEMAQLAARYSNWVEVSGTLKTYKALFPAYPETEVVDLPLPNSDQTAKQEVFIADTEKDGSYSLSAIVYPVDVESSDKDKLNDDLKKALNGVTNVIPDAKLISSRIDVPLEGPRSVEFIIENPETKTYLKGRIMLVKDTIYQIWIDSSEKEPNEKYKYFINSFSPAD